MSFGVGRVAFLVDRVSFECLISVFLISKYEVFDVEIHAFHCRRIVLALKYSYNKIEISVF